MCIFEIESNAGSIFSLFSTKLFLKTYKMHKFFKSMQLVLMSKIHRPVTIYG